MDPSFTIAGQVLHYRLDGPQGAPWLVFSNSLMTDLSLWDEQVAAFGDRYRILRYDQRGHGASAVPGNDCTFDELANDLAALLDHLDVTQATVVGVSMGGITALGLAARHPARVARTALCDCGPASSAAGAAAWDERIALAQAGGMAALVEPTIERWFGAETLRAGVPGPDRVRRMIATTPLEGFVRATRALQSYDYNSLLPTLRGPVAIIVGEADAGLPQVMRGMADACSGATYTAVPGAGHLPNIEQPTRFHAALSALLAA